jgi:hypothetical protein
MRNVPPLVEAGMGQVGAEGLGYIIKYNKNDMI